METTSVHSIPEITSSVGASEPIDYLSLAVLPPGGIAVQLLGDFRVKVGSRCVESTEWDLRKARTLVKLLALAENHQMHRGPIMDLLWPTLSPDAAANNLHKALYLVRRTLELELPPRAPSSYLQIRGDFVQLGARGGVQTDVEGFYAAAKLAISAQDADRCAYALALYSGDLLPEDRYEDWAIAHRERLISLRFDILMCLARLRALDGDLDDAIALVQQAAAIDPLNEQSGAELIRLYAENGQRHMAVQQYRRLRLSLQNELGVEPEAETRKLLEHVVLGGRQRPITSPVTIQMQPQESVSAATSLPFLGRESERARAEQLLDRLFGGEGGLLIVRGEEGIGKSRFAAEVANRAAQLGVLVTWVIGNRTIDEHATSARQGPVSHPTLVVVDDPHDKALAARTVRTLITAHNVSPLLVLLTLPSQKGRLDTPLDDLGDELASTAASCILELPPLEDTTVELLVRRLLGGQVPQSVVAPVCMAANGNPHYVVEAIQALLGRGAIHQLGGRWNVRDLSAMVTRNSLRRPHARQILQFAGTRGQAS